MILLAIQVVLLVLWYTVMPAVSAWLIFIPLMLAVAIVMFWIVFTVGIFSVVGKLTNWEF